MENIEQRVKRIVAQELGINEAEICGESAFFADLGADSLDAVELVMRFEEEFQCRIPDNWADAIVTIQDVVNYINEHISA